MHVRGCGGVPLDLCVDMPNMAGCANYSSMCSNDSVVQQCQFKVHLLLLVPIAAAR